MNDEADKKAAELLPCTGNCATVDNLYLINEHTRTCTAYYRPAIAAALREAYEKGEQSVTWFKVARERAAEIAKLRADLLCIDSDCEQLRNELEAARSQLCTAKDALEWCVKQGGWRLFYYADADAVPECFDDKTDTLKPRLKAIEPCHHRQAAEHQRSEIEKLNDELAREQLAHVLVEQDFAKLEAELEQAAERQRDMIAALKVCRELFSEIRNDWTDPRSECRKGWTVIDAILVHAEVKK